ncbi:MAG: hypothetical protein E7130_01775 [Rikenellaceae bacterium]|nr:hypothetical protein [Rikenellaceae bacterium]MBQ3260646.1 hypothetical protein [Alistipes sp.]MBQ7342311.1 hypothetical protein [Alistipes sp.]
MLRFCRENRQWGALFYGICSFIPQIYEIYLKKNRYTL